MRRERGGAIGLSPSPLVICIICGWAALSGILPQQTYAATEEQYREKTYISDVPGTEQPDGLAPEFEETIIVDGNAYFLQNINYETLSKEPKPDESAEQVKIITSEPFTDDKENHLPEKEREEDGKIYYLQSYEVVDTEIDAREIPVSDVVTYEGVPADSEIPKVATLDVTDEVTGEVIPVEVPLKEDSLVFENEHWSPEFEFSITVTNYEAEVFDLNGQDVPLSIENPLSGYENELLTMIGVTSDNYHINEIFWDGEAYQEDGVLCRKLKATGEMRVVDCHATYSGVAALPVVKAYQIQSVYTDRPASETREETYTYTIKATAKYTLSTEALQRYSIWDHIIQLLKNPVVAVLLLLLFCILVLWLFQRKKKRGNKFLMTISDTDEGEENAKE